MDEESRQNILELYKRGNSLQEVADKVDYHKSTVHRKVNEAGITRSMSEASPDTLSEEHKENIKKGMAESDKQIGTKAKELKKGYDNPTIELGYFLGALAGDGYIISAGGVGLENKDKEFIDAFADVIEKQFGLEPRIYEMEADEMTDWRTGKVHKRSKRWILRKKSVKLRDFCRSVDDDWILDQSEDIKKAWLRGLWDSDGCFSKDSQQVFLYNKEKHLIEKYESILEDLTGIEATHYKQKLGVYKSYFGQKSQVETFYKEIEPTIQRKIDNFQKLLDLQET